MWSARGDSNDEYVTGFFVDDLIYEPAVCLTKKLQTAPGVLSKVAYSDWRDTSKLVHALCVVMR